MIYWSCRETNSQIKRRILVCRVYHTRNISVNVLLNMDEVNELSVEMKKTVPKEK